MLHKNEHQSKRLADLAEGILSGIREDMEILYRYNKFDRIADGDDRDEKKFLTKEEWQEYTLGQDKGVRWGDKYAETVSLIEEGCYGLQGRSGWENIFNFMEGGEVEPIEGRIIIGGGGPASDVIFDICNGEASNPRIRTQDWFTPWYENELSGEDESIVTDWVNLFPLDF